MHRIKVSGFALALLLSACGSPEGSEIDGQAGEPAVAGQGGQASATGGAASGGSAGQASATGGQAPASGGQAASGGSATGGQAPSTGGAVSTGGQAASGGQAAPTGGAASGCSVTGCDVASYCSAKGTCEAFAPPAECEKGTLAAPKDPAHQIRICVTDGQGSGVFFSCSRAPGGTASQPAPEAAPYCEKDPSNPLGCWECSNPG